MNILLRRRLKKFINVSGNLSNHNLKALYSFLLRNSKTIQMRYFLFLLIFFKSSCYCQLNINDLNRFTIGKELFSSRAEIKGLFTTEGRIYKWEKFSSVYTLGFEKTTFNHCENAEYKFLYVYDTLVNVEIALRYEYRHKANEYISELNKDESAKFLQSLEKLLSDLSFPSKGIELQKKYSNLNLKKIKYLVSKKDSILNSKPDDETFIYSGRNVYFYKSNLYDPRILFFNVNYYKTGENKILAMDISITLTSNRFQDYEDKYVEGIGKYWPDKNLIDLTYINGVYSLPVNLNNVMKLDFILDLGASDVSLSPDVFLVLYRAGTIKETDFIGTETYRFADGSTAKSNVFNLSTIKIGDIELKNVRASISNNINSPLLLGQSALKKFSSYKIDNQNNKLIID
ncbi:MAG: retropepsin-like aspartic protease [Leadbetterella sp.]|nr:retropepsin-like aspartic protease [Leadbetterella sp.]